MSLVWCCAVIARSTARRWPSWPAAAAPGEIPTEQDFEEKAATEVTKDNVEAEVEKIEKEISAEQAAAGGGAADPAAGGEKAPAAGEPAPK